MSKALVKTAFSTRYALSLAVVISFIIGLVSCGGDSSGVGSGGTGLASGSQYGAINGFGSVIVESTRYDDSAAVVSIETDPGMPRASNSSELRLGMQVHVDFDSSDRAISIRAVVAAIGNIESIGSNQIQVAGQTILLTGSATMPMVLDGVNAIADLAVGDRVLVYGRADANSAIRATRLERLAAAGGGIPVDNSLVLSGIVNSIDTVSGRITLGTQSISIPAVAVRQPLGFVLSLGQKLSIKAQRDSQTGALTASFVKLDSEAVEPEREWRTSGPLRDLASVQKRFKIDDVTVDYSAASFVDGSVTDLTNGKVVRVKGVSRSGVLVASEVRLISTLDESDPSTVERVDASGEVSEIISPLSFRMRGTVYQLTVNTEIKNGQLSNLNVGTKLRVRGLPMQNVVVVERLEFY